MFPKLLLIVVTITLTAAALLVVRQQRLELAHDVSRLHQRLRMHDGALWGLQVEISHSCRIDDLRLALDGPDGRWIPILAEPPLETVHMAEANSVGAPRAAAGEMGG